jgi:aryl-alcohol dehydrogenase-like predicted oxidoreductase
MRYTHLGATDLHVSKVCFGTWQFGGEWTGLDRDQAIAAVRRARELGIDFFDTAQAYGFGAAETLLAEALGPEIATGRDEIVLATKGGLRREGGRLLRDASPAWLRRGLEESLELLGTDHVDLYQLHWPDPATPIAETARALDGFVREGLVRYIGVSNFDEELLRAFEEVRPLDALQPPYSMLRRGIEERVLPYCRAHGIGVLAYGVLAHGLLTGRYGPETRFPERDWRHGSAIFRGEALRRNVEVVDRLGRVAEGLSCTIAQLGVAWALSNPDVDVAIVGARMPEHIEGTAAAADLLLDVDALAEIDVILEAAAAIGGPTPETA